MTRADFEKKTSRLHTMWVVWLFAFMGVVTPFTVFVLRDAMRPYEDDLRLHFGYFTSWALSFAVVGVGMGLFNLWVRIFDRGMGLRCSHCGYSLSFRIHFEPVLKTGECPKCHTRILDNTPPS